MKLETTMDKVIEKKKPILANVKKAILKILCAPLLSPIENLSETNYGDVHDIYDINDYFTFRILRSANADKKITLKPFVVYDQKVEGTFSYRIEDENEKLLEEESNIQFSKIKDNNKLTDNSKVPNNLNELIMETGAFSPSYSVDSLQLFLESEHFEASKYMRNDKTNSNS